eukprot:scaffold38520_cov57-Phaeocystis_antarctica.AAC.1
MRKQCPATQGLMVRPADRRSFGCKPEGTALRPMRRTVISSTRATLSRCRTPHHSVRRALIYRRRLRCRRPHRHRRRPLHPRPRRHRPRHLRPSGAPAEPS